MRFVTIALVCLIFPCLAIAGAWPRGEGRGFLSLSHSETGQPGDWADPRGYSSLYFESGRTRQLGFGLDAGVDDAGGSAVIAFAVLALPPRASGDLFALQLGAGATGQGGGQNALAQIGASWGRGTNTAWGPGWMSADGQVLVWEGADDPAVKLDLTWGLSPGDRWKLIAQVQSGDYPGSDPYVRLVPSVVRRLGPATWVELAVEAGVAGAETAGLKLAVWFEF